MIRKRSTTSCSTKTSMISLTSKGGYHHRMDKDLYADATSSLVNLVEFVKFDYMVGNINSNWNRLMIKLHLQYFQNTTKFPFLEVGDNPCSTPIQCRIYNKKIDSNW